MINWLTALFTAPIWWSYLLRIICFYLLAWLIHIFTKRLAARLAQSKRLVPNTLRLSPERQATLEGIIASAITFMAFALATLVSIGQFVRIDTLVWMVGLFSAAFGLGARPMISSLLAGLSFMFEDLFGVGEKVEILDIEGVIERVNLRTTWLRAPSGELYIIPNGEILVVRNFSRGLFSMVNVTLKVSTADVSRILTLLEALNQTALLSLPNLLEPWQVISETGVAGQQTELTLTAKARFSKAAELRPRLLAFVQEQLAKEGIQLAG